MCNLMWMEAEALSSRQDFHLTFLNVNMTVASSSALHKKKEKKLQ